MHVFRKSLFIRHCKLTVIAAPVIVLCCYRIGFLVFQRAYNSAGSLAYEITFGNQSDDSSNDSLDNLRGIWRKMDENT